MDNKFLVILKCQIINQSFRTLLICNIVGGLPVSEFEFVNLHEFSDEPPRLILPLHLFQILNLLFLKYGSITSLEAALMLLVFALNFILDLH